MILKTPEFFPGFFYFVTFTHFITYNIVHDRTFKLKFTFFNETT